MAEKFDFCKLFADIEADPHAPLHITVGQYIGASNHVEECDTCMARALRVAAMAPQNPGIDISLN